MSELDRAAADPQVAVDAWTANVEAFRAAADAVSNQQVKDAAGEVRDSLTAVRDAISTIYVQADASAMNELTTATVDMQASFAALSELCAG